MTDNKTISFFYSDEPKMIDYYTSLFKFKLETYFLIIVYFTTIKKKWFNSWNFLDDREVVITEIQEGDILFPVCSYIAENEDAINLVEGERVYVIGIIFIYLFLWNIFYIFNGKLIKT